MILEEINTLRPEMHSALFSVSDFRRAVEAPFLGKTFRVNKGCHFWIVGTMNPGYGGTYSLNEALKSRFNEAEVGYMDEDTEKVLLESRFKSPPAVEERRLVSRLMTLAQESRTGEWDYVLSTRDLVQMVRIYERIGASRMLRMLEAKFEPEHRESIRARVQSTFGVNLNEVELFCSPTTKS